MNITSFVALPDEGVSQEIRGLGIDLGTTNSTVAEVRWEPGMPPVCETLEIEQPTREGVFTSPLVPSVVSILPDNQVWVGEGSKRLRAFSQEANLYFEKNLFYETKNDIGLRKTYFRAPSDFNHTSKIAGHLLSFLAKGSEKTTNHKHENISVTVPASFQLNQRRDTLLACQYAGLALEDNDLLDEPTSALIDYLLTVGYEQVVNPGQSSLCVIFDFGGGTCDVSVVELVGDKASKRITISQLSVSRYHRLGGGDLDAAIVHECLIPDILKANDLTPLDLTWAQKKRGLEPQLLGKAESLKIALSKEIDRLIKFNKYKNLNKSELIAKQPPITCNLGKRQLLLSKPGLSAEQFEELLEPFLDTDSLYARETEFRLTQSIFSPLKDALDRTGKEPHEIDFCLMVGGSSLIPQVRDAVENYFPKGSVGYHEDQLVMQTAVARGAAWNALFKTLLKRPLIQPVLHDGIALITASGELFPLVPSQSTLPYPSDGSYDKVKLVIPQGDLFIDKLRFEVVGEAERQLIFNEIWRLPESAAPGDEITMEYRVTSGKQFQCQAYLTEFPDSVLDVLVENPLVNILNPHTIRVKIEEVEEKLKLRGGGNAEDRSIYIQLAKWYAKLNQREKALDYLRTALNKLQRPDTEILNLQGIYFEELKDHERAEKAYREADRASTNWGGPLFNLALSYRKRGLHQQALDTVDEAIEKEGRNGSYLTLKAMCLKSLKRSEDTQETLSEAMDTYGTPEALENWELGWYSTAADLIGDDEAIEKVKFVRSKRRGKEPAKITDDIQRPDVRGDMIVKE